MPVRAISRSPIANATADAVLQGVLEAGRQAGAESIADVEPDYFAAPITAVTAGATRPALVGSAQGLVLPRLIKSPYKIHSIRTVPRH